MNFKKALISIIICLTASGPIIKAQEILVESIAAIVGQEVILLSTIEDRVYQARVNGDRRPTDVIRCEILESALLSKLFMDQAKIDSIEVNPIFIETDANARINDAIRSAGSEKILEEYFRKSIYEITEDIKESLLEQETVSAVQKNIVQDVTVTPNEVRKYFASIPKDSLPIIPAKVQVSIIQLDVPEYEESKMEARNRLLEIRNRLMEGESFTTLAALYSEDPGTRYNGGEVGYSMKGELDKSYADAAWSLQKDGISRIVESKFGYHLIQLIDKKGDMANTRHILIKPKVNAEQTSRAISRLDSIAQAIRRDSISFADAAMRFSSHKESRTNGGQFVKSDPSDRDRWIELEALGSEEMYLKIRDLKIGEISDPFATTDDYGNTVFRIVRVDDLKEAHRANLKDDYQIINNGALTKKQNEIFSDWVNEKIKVTYIKISDECSSCSFLTTNGWIE